MIRCPRCISRNHYRHHLRTSSTSYVIGFDARRPRPLSFSQSVNNDLPLSLGRIVNNLGTIRLASTCFTPRTRHINIPRMMDARRRTLAQDNNIANMNPVSRLPTSTSKPQGALRSSGSNGNMRASLLGGGGGAGGSQSRMSLAPGSMGLGQPQQPMMGGMGMGMDMGGNRRSTMMPGLGGSQGQAQGGRRDDLMASGGRGDAGIYGRTPGGRQSVMR
jgi:hypothetical protein